MAPRKRQVLVSVAIALCLLFLGLAAIPVRCPCVNRPGCVMRKTPDGYEFISLFCVACGNTGRTVLLLRYVSTDP